MMMLAVVADVLQVAHGALTTEEKVALLAKHNALRGAQSDPCTATNMRQLSWDDQLASVAQAYADTCMWEHNSNRNDEAGYAVGENLCACHRLSICVAAVTACLRARAHRDNHPRSDRRATRKRGSKLVRRDRRLRF